MTNLQNKEPSVAIQMVEFYDDTIRSWREPNGRKYVVLRDPTQALGLDVPAQQRVVLNDELFSGFTIYRPVSTRSRGTHEALGLDLDMVPIWLARIEANRVKPERKEKLLKYQRECAKVLADYWQGRSLIDQIVLPGYRSYEAEYSRLFAARVEHLYGRILLQTAPYPVSVKGFIERYIRYVLPKPARIEIRSKNRPNANGHLPRRDQQHLTPEALDHIERKQRDRVWTLMNEHETVREFEKALWKTDKTLSEAEGSFRQSTIYRIPEVSWQYELPLGELPAAQE